MTVIDPKSLTLPGARRTSGPHVDACPACGNHSVFIHEFPDALVMQCRYTYPANGRGVDLDWQAHVGRCAWFELVAGVAQAEPVTWAWGGVIFALLGAGLILGLTQRKVMPPLCQRCGSPTDTRLVDTEYLCKECAP